MIRRPPRSTPGEDTLSLHDALPISFMGEKKETGAFFCGRVNVGESGGLEKDKQRDMEKVQRWGRVKDSQPIPWPGSPGGAVVPGKAGLSLGSQTGFPPGSSHVILIAPHLAPSSYEWTPRHAPSRPPGLKSSAVASGHLPARYSRHRPAREHEAPGHN